MYVHKKPYVKTDQVVNDNDNSSIDALRQSEERLYP